MHEVLTEDQVCHMLHTALETARAKHPSFAGSSTAIVCLLAEEVGEVARAVNDQDKAAFVSELLDVMTICVRALLGDK